MRTQSSLVASFLTAVIASHASAQSIYIDFGFGGATPSATYAAASGIPGTWNEYPMPFTNGPLVDIFGQPTAARYGAADCKTNGGEDTPTTDDEMLLDDFHYADCAFSQPRV